MSAAGPLPERSLPLEGTARSAKGGGPVIAAGEAELATLRERKRLFDDVWLVTLVVVFVALAAPWFLHVLEIDLAPIAWSLFGFGAVHVAAMVAAEALRSARAVLALAFAQQAAGVLLLSLLWHLGGGVHNPMLLLVFVLPVVAGGMLIGWQSYATAALAAATVIVIALVEAPELRWYLAQLGVPALASGPWWDGLPGTPRPFAGLSAPASYLFVMLQLFVLLLFAVALLAESMRSLLTRLDQRLRVSSHALRDADGLAAEVLRAAPLPTALVYADTYRVAQASDSFLRELRLDEGALAERNLLGLIEFSYPEVVEELIANGGTAPLVTYRLDGETRIARLRVQRLAHGGSRYAHVSLEDIGDRYYLQGALDAMHEAWLVIGANRRLLYLNRVARDLLGAPELGTAASSALAQDGLADDWWELGPRSEQQRHVPFGGRPFDARSIAVRIPGEREPLTLLGLRPVQRPA